MIGTNEETAIILGHKFKYKPYSPKVVKAVKEAEEKYTEQLKSGEIDKFDYYLLMWKEVADGPHELLSKDDEQFNGREFEEKILGFLPPSERLLRLLTGF